MSAGALQDPIPILRYMKHNHLQSHPEFRPLSKFCMSDAKLRINKITITMYNITHRESNAVLETNTIPIILMVVY